MSSASVGSDRSEGGLMDGGAEWALAAKCLITRYPTQPMRPSTPSPIQISIGTAAMRASAPKKSHRPAPPPDERFATPITPRPILRPSARSALIPCAGAYAKAPGTLRGYRIILQCSNARRLHPESEAQGSGYRSNQVRACSACRRSDPGRILRKGNDSSIETPAADRFPDTPSTRRLPPSRRRTRGPRRWPHPARPRLESPQARRAHPAPTHVAR